MLANGAVGVWRVILRNTLSVPVYKFAAGASAPIGHPAIRQSSIAVGVAVGVAVGAAAGIAAGIAAGGDCVRDSNSIGVGLKTGGVWSWR